MHVIGFTIIVGAGWYSKVKHEYSFQEFLERCEFNGLAFSSGGEDEEEQHFQLGDIKIVDYDDDEGVMVFHFERPKFYLQVPPLLRKSSRGDSTLNLVFKEGN